MTLNHNYDCSNEAVTGIAANVLRLAEVPHSRNFGFEQELSCGILANRCYAYVWRLFSKKVNLKTKQKK